MGVILIFGLLSIMVYGLLWEKTNQDEQTPDWSSIESRDLWGEALSDSESWDKVVLSGVPGARQIVAGFRNFAVIVYEKRGGPPVVIAQRPIGSDCSTHTGEEGVILEGGSGVIFRRFDGGGVLCGVMLHAYGIESRQLATTLKVKIW